MNRIQTTIVAALFFSTVGGTCGSSYALQTGSNGSNTNSSTGSGIASPDVGNQTEAQLPPIVSLDRGSQQTVPSNVSAGRAEGRATVLPPIVSAKSDSMNAGSSSSPLPARSGEVDSSRRQTNSISSQSSANAPLSPLRPIQPSVEDKSPVSEGPSRDFNSPSVTGEVAFPRTSLPNQFQMPTHSNSGVPFFSSSSPAQPRQWQDDVPQSVLSNGGVVLPQNGVGFNGSVPGLPNVAGDNGFADGARYFDNSQMGSQSLMMQDNIVGQCPTCGPSGCFDEFDLENRMGYFGAISRARRYLELDMLYLTRQGDSIVFSNFGGVGAFDWRLGWRATLGTRFDEVSGQEFSYFGTENITASENRFDPAGRLSALFFPSSVYTGGETDAFFNAEFQNELMRTRVHSVEFNRVNWAWDVVKSFVGVRFFNVDDLYEMQSQSGADVGTYRLRAKNNLVGLHIGREWFYDVGYRLSFSGLAKGGIYGNASRFRATAISNGTEFLNNSTSRGIFSTNLEFMLTGHYQLTNRARLRAGYQALVLDRMVTVEDNLSGSLNPFLGASKANRDTMFFQGFNVGLELYR